MDLVEKVEQDLAAALRSGNQAVLGTLRLLKNSLNGAAKDKQADLTPEEAVKIVQKEIKQRREAAEGYRTGGREESAAKEEAEITILETYLPEQLSATEVEAIVDKAIADTGAATVQEMGKVMGVVNSQLAGKADMGQVSQLVRSKLGG
ncbi:GatB/YqeY domain-containing protein [Candidatus Microgenomates bacterium]|nr:GatB/YqeY domain-containing protein [Candidatus Microgenomates bacterium]